MPAIVIDEITTLDALDRLRDAWWDLWASCPAATPFQSPAWLVPWWRHVGDGRLLTLAAHEDGRLVGLLPAYVHTAPGARERQLLLLGTGTTDYLDALVAPPRSEHVLAALLERLAALGAAWDACVFCDLEERSALLAAPLPAPWIEERSLCEACPRLRLPPRGQPIDGVIPKRMARNLRYYLGKAEREGGVRWETAGEESAGDLLAALFRLHAARWATRGEAGVIADERVQRAHLASAPELLRAGLLRLLALRIGDRAAAVLYGLADPPRPDRRAYFYLAGWDPELAHLSPGTLLFGHAIEEAAREGMTVVDFVRGREGYKYLWGAADAHTHRRILRRGAGSVVSSRQ
jgi:CelD/BcsL family acetyltransferase involved in cellulose biosynthesis